MNIGILHGSTEQNCLLLGVWRGQQELRLRIYAKDLTSNGPFKRAAVSREDSGGGGVWEPGVICHQRMAWHRNLFSTRTEEDKRAWPADIYAGMVSTLVEEAHAIRLPGSDARCIAPGCE